MLLIKNAYMLDPATGYEGDADILVENGRIKKLYKGIIGLVDESLFEDLEVIDADGLYVAPGLVDVHVHFRDPGFLYKEDITTGAKAAAKGGFTTVVLMANTKPIVDNEETLAYVLEKGKTTDIHVETCCSVSKEFKGQELCDYEKLLENGAVGFTDDGIPLLDEALVTEAMTRLSKLQVPISLHEEDPNLIANNGINRGAASEHFGIGGSPREAEVTMVARDIEIAKKTGAVVNIQHISCKETAEMIRKAKQEGFTNIHGEATPHHFTLTEEAAIKYGTMAKMNPPLRTKEDKEAIIAAIKDGTLDIIATDHAPHSEEEKAKAITEAPSGILGLETAFALGVGELVEKNDMPMIDLIDRMSYGPAKMYNLDAGYIKENGPADFIIFDPNEFWRVEEFQSKSQNSPFIGKMMLGKIKKTICNGKVIYDDEA
ncbi:MAG: dihydroorotase [Lachnospiraceae bacterium]|nr:dihydroorotase [Lachnospiraceae bacterium]